MSNDTEDTAEVPQPLYAGGSRIKPELEPGFYSVTAIHDDLRTGIAAAQQALGIALRRLNEGVPSPIPPSLVAWRIIKHLEHGGWLDPKAPPETRRAIKELIVQVLDGEIQDSVARLPQDSF